MRTVRLCAHCGVRPSRGFSRGTYCGDACKMASYRQRLAAAKTESRPVRLCIVCGEKPVVSRRPGNLHRAKYCSVKCKTAQGNKIGRDVAMLTDEDLLDFPPHIIEARYERARLAKRSRWRAA